MRLTVTSMEKSSTEILTHFTCKEGTYIGIFILRYRLKNTDSVCVFQNL